MLAYTVGFKGRICIVCPSLTALCEGALLTLVAHLDELSSVKWHLAGG